MRTLAMTAGDDKNLVYVIRITDGTNTYKFATQDITLSSNAWDGQALSINSGRYSINEIGKRINVADGGTMGEISTVTFSIGRHTANVLTNTFFNEYYPATSGKILVSAKIELGIIWNTSTSEAEITWLYQYNVDDYNYDNSAIYLICSEFSEFELITLPYYKIQKEFDNGMSYFVNAPVDNYGTPIPVVYGDFTISSGETGLFCLSPAPCVHSTKEQFIIASHPFHTTSVSWKETDEYAISTFVGGNSINNYIRLYKAADTSALNVVYHSVTLHDTFSPIYGDITIPFKASKFNESIANVIDGVDATYTEIDSALSILLNFGTTIEDVNYPLSLSGALATEYATITITFKVSSDDAGNRILNINYLNPAIGTGDGTLGAGSGDLTHTTGTTMATFSWDMAGDATGKTGATLPWTFEELGQLEYVVYNGDADPGDLLRVHGGYVYIADILITAVTRATNIRSVRGQIRNNTGGRGRR